MSLEEGSLGFSATPIDLVLELIQSAGLTADLKGYQNLVEKVTQI